MKKSKSKGRVDAGSKSESRSRKVDEQSMRGDLKEVIDRHSRGLDERCPEGRDDSLVSTRQFDISFVARKESLVALYASYSVSYRKLKGPGWANRDPYA